VIPEYLDSPDFNGPDDVWVALLKREMGEEFVGRLLQLEHCEVERVLDDGAEGAEGAEGGVQGVKEENVSQAEGKEKDEKDKEDAQQKDVSLRDPVQKKASFAVNPRASEAEDDYESDDENDLEITPDLELEQLLGGISWVPTFSTLQLKPDDEWYLIIASDGLWEFVTPTDVAKATGKKIRLRGVEGAAKYLIEVAQRRWEHMEPEYTDDCTVCVVQFNSPAVASASSSSSSGAAAGGDAAGGAADAAKQAAKKGAKSASGLRVISLANVP